MSQDSITTVPRRIHAFEVKIYPDPISGKTIKKPALSNWQTSTCTVEEFEAFTNRGICIPPGVMAIDIDPGQEDLDFVYRVIEDALDCRLNWEGSLLQSTPRGGRHHVFAVPPSARIRQGSNILGVRGFDIRASGDGFLASGKGYTSLCDMPIYDMLDPVHVELPKLPAGALGMLSKQASEEDEFMMLVQQADKFTNEKGLPLSIDEMQTYLDQLPIEWCLERDQWLSVGMAIHHQTDGSKEGWKLFDKFSRRALEVDKDKYDRIANKRSWTSFGNSASVVTWKTIADAVQDKGEEIDLNDMTEDDLWHEREVKEASAFPESLLHCGGLLGAMMEAVAEQSYTVNPILDFTAALSTLVHLSNNAYIVEETSTPLQPYLVAIAGTGAGKTSRINFSARVCRELDLDTNIAASVSSGAALWRYVSSKQTVTLLLDEFGRKLADRAKANNHTDSIVTTLLEFYGLGNSHLGAKIMAQTKDNCEGIERPAVNFLGISTRKAMMEAFSEDDFEAGLMNRLTVIDAGMPVVVKESGNNRFSDSLKAYLQELTDVSFALGFDDDQAFVPIRTSPTAKQMLGQVRKEQTEVLNSKQSERVKSLWGRTYQQVAAMSGVFALSNAIDFAAPMITETEVELAKALVYHCQAFFTLDENEVGIQVSTYGKPVQRCMDRALGFLGKTNELKGKPNQEIYYRKGCILASDLLSRCGRDKQVFDTAITTLLAMDMIEKLVVKTAEKKEVKPTSCYKLTAER